MRKLLLLSAIVLLLSCSNDESCDEAIDRLYEKFQEQIDNIDRENRSPENIQAAIQRLKDERDLKIMKACS